MYRSEKSKKKRKKNRKGEGDDFSKRTDRRSRREKIRRVRLRVEQLREPATYNLMCLMIRTAPQEREWRTKVVVFLVRPMFSWPRW